MIIYDEIAPADAASPFRCSGCKEYYFPDGVFHNYEHGANEFVHLEREVVCPTPECAGYITDVDLLVRHDSKEFLNVGGCFDATWYHATDRGFQWRSKLMMPDEFGEITFAHMGTFDAAMDRYRQTNYSWLAKEFVMHEIKILDHAEFYPAVGEDRLTWEMNIPPHKSPPPITRYLNRYESPGSISLLADPRLFEVVKSYSIEEVLECAPV